MALEPRNRQEDWYKEMIDAIGEGGGSGLPEVTSADNGKVLTAADGAWAKGVQEYWIPLTASGSELSIPDDKQIEVATAINDAGRYWVRGVVINNAYLSGYVSNSYDFIVPLSKSFMHELGFDCAGKIHIVNANGYTVSIEPDKFIVTLTPTAQDYSGTMDKTVAEINAAYEAGQEIVFRFMTSATSYMDVDCTARYFTNGYTYPSFNVYIVGDGGVLYYAFTSTTDDGTKQTYGFELYTLTHAT